LGNLSRGGEEEKKRRPGIGGKEMINLSLRISKERSKNGEKTEGMTP